MQTHIEDMWNPSKENSRHKQILSPLKTNMEPENAALEKETYLETTNVWVPC